MLGELLREISAASGVEALDFDLNETQGRLEDYLVQGRYFVFVARARRQHPEGSLTLCETCALYPGGTFGIIPELYVRPA